MPRRSAVEPRSAASVPAHEPVVDAPVSQRSHALTVPAPKTKGGGLKGALKGLSSRVSVADMVRLQADRAQQEARMEASAQGKSSEDVRKAGNRARAAAIKEGAAKAGVSPITARRWARGTQHSSQHVEKAARAKVQRSMGGAKGVRAAQVATSRHVDVGKVKVHTTTGSKGSADGYRSIGGVSLTEEEAANLAKLIEQGNDTQAAEDLGKIVLARYGERSGMGSMDFMEIVDLLDAVTWR